MKLRSKIAVSAALLGAFTTAVQAESITFGVEIPPVASLLVRDGVVRGIAGLTGTVAGMTGSTSITVGGFTVVTNMPKWNLYFAFANNGNLINSSGSYLKASGGNYLPLGVANNAAVTPGQVWLKFPTANQINGNDGAATPLTISATAATMGAAAADGIVTSTINTLSKVLNSPTTATVCGTAVCADNGWIFATSSSTATFDIGTALDNTVVPTGLAGTYTETMYVTLVTAY
jgi:hypothetical protein